MCDLSNTLVCGMKTMNMFVNLHLICDDFNDKHKDECTTKYIKAINAMKTFLI